MVSEFRLMGLLTTWIAGFSLALLVLAVQPAASVKCFKDATLPEYPINVYYCNDSSKPECCTTDSFTCCASSSTTNWQNMVIIFGVSFGFIFLVLGAWMCFRKDTDFCLCDGKCVLTKCAPCCIAICTGEERPEKVSPPKSAVITSGSYDSHVNLPAADYNHFQRQVDETTFGGKEKAKFGIASDNISWDPTGEKMKSEWPTKTEATYKRDY